MTALRPANRRVVVGLLFLASGCTSVHEPLGVSSAHPASADAAESPRMHPSSILGTDSEEARVPDGDAPMATGPRNGGHGL